MKYANRLLFAFVFTFLLSCQQQVPNTNSDSRVWNEPSKERSSFTLHNGGWDFNIQKVLFGDTETTVYMRVRGYSGNSYTFDAGTTLRADGKSYKLISIDGLVPGQYKPMGSTNNDDLIFHFEPMPLDTKSFHLLESENNPRAFNIFGIHQSDANSPVLKNTHWRNQRTGDWTISFMEDYVIYDCKIWTYETALSDSMPSAQTITIANDGQKATVQIGAIKSGKRTIKVQAPNGSKQYRCTAFDSRKLPEYPRVARRAVKLVDYGYENVDTVTISGILLGYNRNNTTFSIDFSDPIADCNPEFTFNTDQNGFFTVRFPLANTSFAVVRHRRGAAGFSIPLEPGRTYFVYSDVVNDREYVMGEKSRLQNEFMAYQDEFFPDYERIEETSFESDMDAYLDYLIEQRNVHSAILDSLQKVHPSLSDAFLDMARVSGTIELYQMIGQARFHNEERRFAITDRMMDFIRKDMKVNSIKPYSLFYDFNYFLRDFIQNLHLAENGIVTVKMSQILNVAIKNGIVDLSADEKESLIWFAQMNDRIGEIIEACKGDSKLINDTLPTILTPELQPQFDKVSKLVEEKGLSQYINDCANRIVMEMEINRVICALDTLGFEKRLNEIMLTHYMVDQITSSRHSSPAAILAVFDSIVTYKPCLDVVHAQNDKYLALETVDLASLGNTVSADEIASMSDGELILRKLTEPYRGKIVYIDVWGSWCHPCLENLKHAGELKEQLKDFDIVYLYLASGTTDSAWKGVIKEYNLTGENCVHYNLPAEQQTLIEQYLNVTGYPTYRLLNRNGALLNVNCSPNDVPALKNTLQKL